MNSQWCCRFKGISKEKSGKFHAKITIAGMHKKQTKFLGSNLDAEEAAKAFDAAKIFLV